ncbi:MAG TPA: hypothetical protein VF883_07415 [Thermoanaerobaculia bacterium]|jgi:hypothetical protein
MAKTVEKTERELEPVEDVLAEIRAIPSNSLSGDEWLAYLRRLPKPDLPQGWTSADDIRELRGPLPEDDPDYQRNILGDR